LKTERKLLIQRNVEFRRELVGVERTTGKIPFSDLDGWHFPEPFVHLQDEILGVGLFVDVHFREINSAFPEKLLSAAAIHTPIGSVKYYLFHSI
jgi:hypothetical protein